SSPEISRHRTQKVVDLRVAARSDEGTLVEKWEESPADERARVTALGLLHGAVESTHEKAHAETNARTGDRLAEVLIVARRSAAHRHAGEHEGHKNVAGKAPEVKPTTAVLQRVEEEN